MTKLDHLTWRSMRDKERRRATRRRLIAHIAFAAIVMALAVAVVWGWL